MTKEKAEKLMQLFENGYAIKFSDGGYVDTPEPANSIFPYDPKDDPYYKTRGRSPILGEIVYNSAMYSCRPLSEVAQRDVSVFKDVTEEFFPGGDQGSF